MAAGVNYYVSLQPQAATDNFYQLTVPSAGISNVFVSYPDLSYPQWTPGSTVWAGTAYDINFRLTGVPVPEPASFLLLGLAALLLRRR